MKYLLSLLIILTFASQTVASSHAHETELPKSYNLLMKLSELDRKQTFIDEVFNTEFQQMKKNPSPETIAQFQEIDNTKLKDLLNMIPVGETTVADVITIAETKWSELQTFWNEIKFRVILAIRIYFLVANMLLIALLLAITKKTFPESAMKLQNNFWESVIAGLIFFVGLPIVGTILFITIIGIPLSIILLLISATISILATSICPIVIAQWLSDNYKLNSGKVSLFFMSTVIYTIMVALLYVPYLWWVINLIIVIPTLGAFLYQRFEVWKNSHNTLTSNPCKNSHQRK